MFLTIIVAVYGQCFRDDLREILHDHFPEEFDARVAGHKRAEQHRTPLEAFGPWHQEHSDGHEKLAQQGLRMGDGIHLPIYASKDQWSAFLHSLLLLPNVRNSNAIVHYYLDLVEDRGCEQPLMTREITADSFLFRQNFDPTRHQPGLRS
jgi:hypothetical protein